MGHLPNEGDSVETDYCDMRYGVVKSGRGEFSHRLEFPDGIGFPRNKLNGVAMDTEKQLSDWVQRALDYAGMKQAELSRALIQSGLSTIDRSAVNKVVLGTRKLSGEEMIEVSRITGYPIPDRRIKGRPVEKEEEKPAPAPAHNDDIVNVQREMRLRTLVSKVLEAQGMTAAMAERLAAAIARVADMPQDPRSAAADQDQTQAEARLLVALFDPQRPL
jgi:hypothetical protein